MRKIVLRQQQIKDDPDLLWNSFIDVISGEEDPTRSPLQRQCHLCFRYYGEVMNGGHFQFFENQGIQYGRRVLEALHGLGLTKVAYILNDALAHANSMKWGVINTVEEYVEESSAEPFQGKDDAFYSLSPDLFELLFAICRRQPDDFFTIVP